MFSPVLNQWTDQHLMGLRLYSDSQSTIFRTDLSLTLCFQNLTAHQHLPGHEESSAVGLPCPISNTSALAGGTPFPSVAVVGDVIKAVRATVEQLSWRLEMDDCASARRVLRTLVLRQTSELWETLAEEPRIRKGLVRTYKS